MGLAGRKPAGTVREGCKELSEVLVEWQFEALFTPLVVNVVAMARRNEEGTVLPQYLVPAARQFHGQDDVRADKVTWREVLVLTRGAASQACAGACPRPAKINLGVAASAIARATEVNQKVNLSFALLNDGTNDDP